MIFRTKQKKQIKITVCIIAALMLFVVLFSSFYIAAEADHECTGEDCSVCACIEQCETTLHQLAGCAAAVLLSVLTAVFVLRLITFVQVFLRKKTPVSLRTRLNH